MKINWTSCSSRMPHDDCDLDVIAKGETLTSRVIKKVTGAFMHRHIDYVDRALIEWTEYTKEKWEYLNRES